MPHRGHRYVHDHTSESSSSSDNERRFYGLPSRRRRRSAEPRYTQMQRQAQHPQQYFYPVALNPSAPSTTTQVTAATSPPTVVTNLTATSRQQPFYIDIVGDRQLLQPRGRSHSPHCHHCHGSRHGSWSPNRPHIPPRGEEEEFILARDKSKRDHEEDLRQQAIRDFQLKEMRDKLEKERIIQ